MVVVGGGTLEPEAVAAVAIDGVEPTLAPAGLERMAAARRVVERVAADGTPVYGVTRGLGARAGEQLAPEHVREFSLLTIRGRAHAVGEADTVANVRAAMTVRLHTLLNGHAGASPAVAEHLRACLVAGLTPVVGQLGSVGAGDLTWNATMALALIGEGDLRLADGTVLPGAEALAQQGIPPLDLGPRDGLALINHSSGVAGAAALALVAAETAFAAAQSAAALSLEAFRANLLAFAPAVLGVRPSPGQDLAAAQLRARLAGGALEQPEEARRLQDPLSFRNLPQLHGAVVAALAFAREAVVVELNGSSDNPVVLVEEDRIASCGAYFTAELGSAIETCSRSFVQLAFAQLARMAKLLDPQFSDLPLFLAQPDIDSNGFAPLMKVAEALVAELVHTAAPAPLWPSINANGVEDCLTTAPVAVRALARIAELSSRLTAIELMVAARAVELRGDVDRLAPFTAATLAAVRERSPGAIDHRPLGDDVEVLAAAVRARRFAG